MGHVWDVQQDVKHALIKAHVPNAKTDTMRQAQDVVPVLKGVFCALLLLVWVTLVLIALMTSIWN
jgi:hypothetical protein